MTYTYFIDDRQVFPWNRRELGITVSYEDEFIRDYRKTLDGNITLINDPSQGITDYDYIKDIEIEEGKHTLTIYESGAEHFKAEFTIADISFDDYKSTAVIKVQKRDKYTEIQECEDIEVNVLDGLVANEIRCGVYSYWYFFGRHYSGALGGLPATDILIASTAGAGASNGVYCTELLMLSVDDEVPTFVGGTWTEYADLGDYIVYQRCPVNFPSYTMGFEIIWSGHLTYEMVGFPTHDDTYNEYHLNLGVLYTYDGSKLWVKKSLYNGRANLATTKTLLSYHLSQIVNKIVDVAMPNFTGQVVSTFLFEDQSSLSDFVSGETTYSELGDYYTALFGVRQPKFLVDICDFKKPNAQENTSVSKTTWKKVIESLCTRFNCRWHIDGDIRIEHVVYYDIGDPEIVLDSTTKKYSYIDNGKPNREWFDEQQTWNEDFKKKELLYGTVPAMEGMKENTKTTSVTDLFTDVDGMNQHLDELSNEGFVMVEVYQGSAANIFGEVVTRGTGSVSTETSLQNVSISLGNCLFKYYVYEAFQDTYTIDEKPATAKTIKWDKKHEIEFVNDDIPDTSKGITTWLGEGRIISLKYQLVKEGKFKAELRYK